MSKKNEEKAKKVLSDFGFDTFMQGQVVAEMVKRGVFPDGKPKTARPNRDFPIYIEIDGERHIIGEAHVNSDGTFDCMTNMIEYHGNYSGNVRGFFLDPTTDLSGSEEE